MGVYQQVEDQILLLDSDKSGPVLQVGEWIGIDLEKVLDRRFSLSNAELA